MDSIKIVNQKPPRRREKERNPFEPRGFAGTVYTMYHDIVCTLAVIVIVFVLAVRLVGVSGSSMYPTLVGKDNNLDNMGDYLLLRSNFLSSSYEQGDIVVACIPSFKDGQPIVKRVIATGGQTVSFRIGEDLQMHVYVDGALQPEDYINEPMAPWGLASSGFSETVPEGCYFLMGDNRNNSADSREPTIGMVDGRYIVGKAVLLLFPGQDIYQNHGRTWNRMGDIYD
ncbi:MAG: signal peptidase I [Oscillospiraceae bacterium]|nr:signal peptidase I [Oscillospiraceae bacterium]